MSILKTLLIGLVGLVALLALIGFFLPSSTHVERSTVIEAPQSTAFALVNGYRRFNEWSPWAKIDPAARYSYEGPDQGVGAKMAWESEDSNVGNGSQQITASEPFSRVEAALDFGPQGTADAFFDLVPEGTGTRVTWGFDSDVGMNLIGRYFGLMMDGMLGPMYEEGLTSLKKLAESLPAADWSDLELETTEVEPMTIAYLSASSSQEDDAIAEAHGAAYGEVSAFIARHSLTPTGQPITINTLWGQERYSFDAGIPVADATVEVAEGSAVQLGQTYGGAVLKIVHTGAYQDLQATYEKIEAYVGAHGLETVDRSWVEWVSDPSSTPEDELITHIFFPVE